MFHLLMRLFWWVVVPAALVLALIFLIPFPGRSVERRGLTVYYRKPVKEKTAERVADALIALIGDHDPGERREVMIALKDGKYHLRFALPTKTATPGQVAGFRNRGTQMLLRGAIPHGRPLVVDLCDASFGVFRSVPVDAVVRKHPWTVSFRPPVTRSKATATATVLVELLDGVELDRERGALLVREHDTYRLRFVAAKKDVTPDAVAGFQHWGVRLLKRRAIPSDHPLIIELCDGAFKPHRELRIPSPGPSGG